MKGYLDIPALIAIATYALKLPAAQRWPQAIQVGEQLMAMNDTTLDRNYYLRLANAGDEVYESALGYPGMPRTFVAWTLARIRSAACGMFWSSSRSKLVPRAVLLVSTAGVSPVTVMVSSSELTCNVVFTVATNVPLSATPSRLTVLKPGSTKVTV